MNPIHILLVEDNEGDILLTTEALESGKISNTISVTKDGKAAIDFLNKSGKYEHVTCPDLVLLDVNLPKKNGQEVLRYIKESELLKRIPVIILTTSSSKKDVLESYNNRADLYITKPVDANDFIEAVNKIENFWLSIMRLPGNKN